MDNKQFEPTYTLAADQNVRILDYIPAQFDGKNNDFDEQALALFLDCNQCCTYDFTALGFVEGVGLTVYTAGPNSHILFAFPIEKFGCKLPFSALMRNYFGEDWDTISKSVTPYPSHGGGKCIKFIVHDSCNGYYIHVKFDHLPAGEERLTMIFAYDQKK